jgi:imidazolonepropionase-like amidohydrolase
VSVLLKNGQVWLEHTWRKSDIMVEKSKITQIADSITSKAEREIDVAGKFVLPGIIDCHVHLSMNGGPHPMADMSKCRESEAFLVELKSAEELVRSGITTVRDCGGIACESIVIRDAISAGKVIGPRVIPCISAIKIPGGHFYGMEVTGPQEARKAARVLIRDGAEFIKLMATGGLGKIGEQPGVVELDVDEMKAAIDEGKKHGMASSAHCHSKEGMMNALEAGVSTLEHCTFLDDEVIEKMLEQDVFMVPTFSPYCQMDRYGLDNGVSPYMCKMSKDICAYKNKTFPKAYKKGVKIAFGRDAGAPLTRHGEYFIEMSEMEAAGVSRKDIIISATETAAKALRIYDETGSLETGKSADILVLDADPLHDLLNFKKVSAVIADGRLIH